MHYPVLSFKVTFTFFTFYPSRGERGTSHFNSRRFIEACTGAMHNNSNTFTVNMGYAKRKEFSPTSITQSRCFCARQLSYAEISTLVSCLIGSETSTHISCFIGSEISTHASCFIGCKDFNARQLFCRMQRLQRTSVVLSYQRLQHTSVVLTDAQTSTHFSCFIGCRDFNARQLYY